MIKDQASNRARAERISNLEEEVVSGSNIDLKNKLEYATKALDRGINDESLLEMCSIVYLPTLATPNFPRNTERSQLDAWVKLETYETSLDR